MCRDLHDVYIPACVECQRNKSCTSKPPGPLHPLPIPDQCGNSIAINFIGPCPEDDGFNSIVTITDQLGADIHITTTHTDITAEHFTAQFFDLWYCENGLPLNIVCDWDHLFVSKFWKALTKLTGVKLKMSTAYHPQTDGSSEWLNKTIMQALHYHVACNQKGWACALLHIHFNVMNMVNVSTGFSSFQLRMGRSPWLIPPLINEAVTKHATDNSEATNTTALIEKLALDVMEAQDNLLTAKVSQVKFSW